MQNVFLIIIILVAILIGYLIPVPSPFEIETQKSKKPYVNCPRIKPEIENVDILNEILNNDIENRLFKEYGDIIEEE